MEPPAGFVWEQRDAMRLRCERCGDIVRAEVLDIHLTRCPEIPRDQPQGGPP